MYVHHLPTISSCRLTRVSRNTRLRIVNKTTAFGAFISLMPGRDGLLHISNIGGDRRVEKVEDEVSVGEKLQVEIADIDNRGKISLVLVED